MAVSRVPSMWASVDVGVESQDGTRTNTYSAVESYEGCAMQLAGLQAKMLRRKAKGPLQSSSVASAQTGKPLPQQVSGCLHDSDMCHTAVYSELSSGNLGSDHYLF